MSSGEISIEKIPIYIYIYSTTVPHYIYIPCGSKGKGVGRGVGRRTTRTTVDWKIIIKMDIENISIKDILTHYGHDPGMVSGDIGRCACPLHHGENNNFSYRGSLYYCWTCQARGNAVGLVAEMFNLKRWQAVMRIKTDFGIVASGDGLSYRELKRRREELKAQQLNNDFLDGLEQILLKHRRLIFWHYGEDNEQIKYLDRLLDRFITDRDSFLLWEIDTENLLDNLYEILEGTNWHEF